MSEYSLVSLGTMALDSVETPYGRVENTLGGSGTFFSVAASFFCKPAIVSVVGADFPKEHLSYLTNLGINIEGVEIADGKTFHWEGKYEGEMNNAETLKTDLNVLASFSPKIPKSYRGCNFLFLANIDPEIQLKVLDEIKPKYCLCDTMNFWIKSKKESLTQVFEKVDGIIINEAEARDYCGTKNLIAAGKKLCGIGKSKVIIKKGEHGCLLFMDDEVTALPAYPTSKVVDPTGAGDSFAGGACGYLASKNSVDIQDFKRAIAYGTVIASHMVEDFSLGGINGKTMEDIEVRLNELRQTISF